MSYASASAVGDIDPRVELLSPDEVRTRLLDDAEIAVVDVSEGVEYQAGHLSVSVPVAASVIELHLGRILPRLDIPIVLVSSGDGSLAERSVHRIVSIGYTDVSVLQGGSNAWRDAGYELVTGPNSLSKAFGEFVEREYETPKISVTELASKLAGGADVVVLDTRPVEEYRHVSIPTAANAPGVELLHRAFDAVSSPDSEVVVNCAGRTRAIIGAQALINASFPNKVYSLENGTGAWALAGLESDRGAARNADAPSAEGLARAVEAADRIGARFGVTRISAEYLEQIRNLRDSRTVYIVDVRTEEEFFAGHLPDSRWVAGGQLVQETDLHLGTRRGIVVLVDDAPSVRAVLTASWLLQSGLDDVFVHELDPDADLVSGVETHSPNAAFDESPSITVERLTELRKSANVVILDLEGERPAFARVPHITGALVARRSSISDALAAVDPGVDTVILTSYDGVVAQLAAAESVGADHPFEVRALVGGTRAWEDFGGDLVHGLNDRALIPGEELTPSLSELPDPERQERLDRYVRWGDEVIDQLRRDGLVRFRSFPDSPTSDRTSRSTSNG